MGEAKKAMVARWKAEREEQQREAADAARARAEAAAAAKQAEVEARQAANKLRLQMVKEAKVRRLMHSHAVLQPLQSGMAANRPALAFSTNPCCPLAPHRPNPSPCGHPLRPGSAGMWSGAPPLRPPSPPHCPRPRRSSASEWRSAAPPPSSAASRCWPRRRRRAGSGSGYRHSCWRRCGDAGGAAGAGLHLRG